MEEEQFTTIGMNSDLRDRLKLMSVHQKKSYEKMVEDLMSLWKSVVQFENVADFKTFAIKNLEKQYEIVYPQEKNYIVYKTKEGIYRAYCTLTLIDLPQDCDEYIVNFASEELVSKGKFNGKNLKVIRK